MSYDLLRVLVGEVGPFYSPQDKCLCGERCCWVEALVPSKGVYRGVGLDPEGITSENGGVSLVGWFSVKG